MYICSRYYVPILTILSKLKLVKKIATSDKIPVAAILNRFSRILWYDFDPKH